MSLIFEEKKQESMAIKALRACLPVCSDKDNMWKTETVSDKVGCKDKSLG